MRGERCARARRTRSRAGRWVPGAWARGRAHLGPWAGPSTCVGGAPPPAPHAPRRAHAHLPCPSRAPPRAILCPIASQLTACVCPESCRSRRELSNEVLYVYWGRVFCLEMRSKSQNFPPGLRPGPRDETPSPDAPPRRSGGVVPAQRLHSALHNACTDYGQESPGWPGLSRHGRGKEGACSDKER